jgi:zinc protease
LAIFIIITTGATAASINAPVVSVKLDNGLRVIVQKDHSTNLVAVDIWVRAGSINETDDINGTAHFIEHLLFKGTKKRGPGQVDMEIESLGASLEAKTGKDWAHFYTTVAKRYLDKSLDVLADVITHPRLDPEDIEHERQVILDEIARSDSDPSKAIIDLAYQTAFTIHSYKLPILGTRESVSKIKPETITSFYNELYVPENTTIVLVGDITPDEAVVAVKNAFSDFKRKSLPATTMPKEPERTEQVRKVVKRNTRLTYLAIAFPAPSIYDLPDVYAMDLLTSYLGTGYQSWLATELKNKKKLAVEVSSDFLSQRAPGLAVLSVAVEPTKVEDAEKAILAKIADLRANPIANSDLDRARRSLEGGFAFDTETFSGRATTLGFYASIGDYELAQSYIPNLRKVTPQDILNLAKKYLDPDRAVIVVLGP